MALGTSKKNLFAMIVLQSMRPVTIGLGVGLILSLAASHLLRTLLYGLGTIDAFSFIWVSLFFMAISLFAAYVPSRAARESILSLPYAMNEAMPNKFV